MSKYRESYILTEREYPDFNDIEVLNKLLESKKLTERQKKALYKLIQYYYSRD